MKEEKIKQLEEKLIEICRELDVNMVTSHNVADDEMPLIIYDSSSTVYELRNASRHGVNK